ncbi:MAG TPA: TA system VapC family ribonuclease toxin [Vicinamibacterales bacterium]|nr:TA system VapC family ribonuclease toxin [Vicinamibacterales bacterium]
MNRVHLLDVNVLVALFDPDHVHHDIAHDWFADYGRAAWATCPVTENGFLRVLANPAYGAPVARVAQLIERLREFRASGGHAFWHDEVSLADETLFDPAMMAGHRQLTDVYLLGLAVRKGGSLASFDRTIPVKAVRGATSETLQVIEPAAAM